MTTSTTPTTSAVQQATAILPSVVTESLGDQVKINIVSHLDIGRTNHNFDEANGFIPTSKIKPAKAGTDNGMGWNTHNMVHGIGIDTNKTELYISYTKACLNISNPSVNVRLLGQITAPNTNTIDGSEKRTFDVYAMVITRKDGAFILNADCGSSDNTGVMREFRQSVEGNGSRIEYYSYGAGNKAAINVRLIKTALDPEVFDFYAPSNYDDVIKDSGDARSLSNYLSTDLRAQSHRDHKSYETFVTEAALRDLDDRTIPEFEEFSPQTRYGYNDDKANYTIRSWEDDRLILSSGIGVQLKKEDIVEFITGGYETSAKLNTPYGTIKRHNDPNVHLLVCGCHRVDLDEVREHVGLPPRSANLDNDKSDEFTGVNSDDLTMSQINKKFEDAWTTIRDQLNSNPEEDIEGEDYDKIKNDLNTQRVDALNERCKVLVEAVGLKIPDPAEDGHAGHLFSGSRDSIHVWFGNIKRLNRDRFRAIHTRVQRSAYAKYISTINDANAEIDEKNRRIKQVSKRFDWINEMVFDLNGDRVVSQAARSDD